MQRTELVTDSQSIANIVLEHSETAEVFQRHRIDFCCRGARSVETAARERGLEPDELLRQLRRAIDDRRGGEPGEQNLKELSTAALVDYIVGKHHAYLRKTLPFLVPLAKKVARVHGEHNPKLEDLRDAVEELSDALLPHLDEEEQDLFPALRQTTGVATGDAAHLLGTMIEDHLAVAALLERIRNASDDFTIPDWACSSYRTLFGELRALERDTFMHVHLENHVLKPRFETQAPATSTTTFSLAREAAALRATPAWQDSGHSAKSLVRTADARVVLISMRAGAKISEHKTDHGVLVQVLDGRVQLQMPTERVALGAQEMLFLEAGEPHDVVAQEDSTVLVTISWCPAA